MHLFFANGIILLIVMHIFISSLGAREYNLEEIVDHNIVLSTKEIYFPDFPGAFNPSIFKTDEGYIFVFRYSPNPYWDLWTTYMCAALLDDSFELIAGPDVLSTGLNEGYVKSQAEDPRIFSFQGKLYLIYNDNIEISRPWARDRRDMYLAELIYENGSFSLHNPTQLIYAHRYKDQYWQKNWTPFEWEGHLLCGYSINPHEILYVNPSDGACFPCYETNPSLVWPLGTLRGSSPALLVGEQYLSFFHAGHQLPTNVSHGEPRWHYFMGAYTFRNSPPFTIEKISPIPIVGEGFYDDKPARFPNGFPFKKVIFPGGFVIEEDRIILAYGRNDEEMWIAELDKKELMDSLVPIQPSSQTGDNE